MVTLDLVAGLSNGNRTLPLVVQAVRLFLREGRGRQRQRTTSAEWPSCGWDTRFRLCYCSIAFISRCGKFKKSAA